MFFQRAVYGQIDCRLPISIDTNYKDNNTKDNNIYKWRFPFKDSANQSVRNRPWCLAHGKECSSCFRSVFESSCERHTPDLVTHLVAVNNKIIIWFFHFFKNGLSKASTRGHLLDKSHLTHRHGQRCTSWVFVTVFTDRGVGATTRLV